MIDPRLAIVSYRPTLMATDRGCKTLARRLPALLGWRRQRTLGLEEGQQVGVQLVLVRAGEAVRCARIDLQRRVLDDF